MHPRRLISIVLALSFCATPPGLGSDDHRPRVALVLSGGGARGLAHVGVLKVIERAGVPIDLVVGTSVGAVVGGVYATGVPPRQMETILSDIDWEALFRGKPARQSLSFRRKQDEDRYTVDFEVGFRDGEVRSSRGAFSGLELDFLLQRFTLPAAGIHDFDELPIRFRAVATDLVSGEKAVLGSGSLGRAIRASMSIPGVFPPVEQNGMVLVDGELLDNLPIEVARELGAELVIAVDTTPSLLSSEELNSMAGIVSQSMSVAAHNRISVQRRLADIVITPELEGVGNLEFRRVDELIDRGEEAGERHRRELEALATRIGGSDPTTPGTALDTLPTITGVSIEGNRRVDARLIDARLRTETGEPLDLDVLRGDLSRVIQIGEFESVVFDIEPTSSGSELGIEVAEKPWGPHYLRFGTRIDGDLEGNTEIELLVNYTQTSLNARGAEWSTDFRIGQTRGVRSEFYQQLDFRGRFFVAPAIEHRREITDVYVDGDNVAEFEVESATASLDVGTQFGAYGELRVGLRRGQVDTEIRVGAPELPGVDVDVGGIDARLAFDRLDRSAVPRRGRFLRVSGFRSDPVLGAEDSYTKLEGLAGQFVSRGPHTLFGTLDVAGTPAGDRLPVYDEVVRGGLFSFSGFAEDELRGQAAAILRLGYLHRLLALPPAVGTALSVGGWIETGNVWESRDAASLDDLRTTGTVAIAADTRLGPLYLGYGSTDEDGQFHLSLGSSF